MSKLILAVPGFYPDSRGGAARQALILATALGRRGVDVTIVAPTTSSEAPAVEATEFGRIERFHVAAHPNKGGRHMGSFLAWTMWFWRRFGGREHGSVPIYAFHARLHALGPALASGASGAPLLIKLGGGGEASDFAALRAKKYFYGHWVQALLLKRVDRFVANSDQIASDLKALGVDDSRIAAFPNGVMLRGEEEIRESLNHRAGNRFLFAGRLMPDKRVDILCEAALRLASSGQGPRMVFLGDGPEQERLAAIYRNTPHADLLTFPGFVSDVYPDLLQSDFFVSASMREGQSNALLEAMSAGVVPVVYAASGAADVIEHGRTGFLVSQSEPEAFAAAMREAMELSPGRRKEMALAARRFAEDNIGIDAIAARTAEMLSSLPRSRGA